MAISLVMWKYQKKKTMMMKTIVTALTLIKSIEMRIITKIMTRAMAFRTFTELFLH